MSQIFTDHSGAPWEIFTGVHLCQNRDSGTKTLGSPHIPLHLNFFTRCSFQLFVVSFAGYRYAIISNTSNLTQIISQDRVYYVVYNTF